MTKFLLLAFLLAFLATGREAGAQSALPNRLELYAGQVAVYRTDRSLQRVAVGNGDLVAVTTIEKRQVVVIAGAKAAGQTTMHLWFEDGSQRSVDVNVGSANVSEASENIRRMLGPGSAIQVMDIGGNVVISGELGANDATRLQAIKKLYPDIVDLSVADPVGMQPMVLMDVRIMEFNKSALRNLGVRWQSVIDGPSGGAIKDFSNTFYRVLPDGSPFGEIPLPANINSLETYFGIATTISSSIDILTETGDAYELASPQLSARSGGTATFLAGGEIPIPVTGSFGSTNVEYKDYGIKLDIQPSVNGNNEISTTILTEVSRIDDSVSIQGIPGFLTRRTETELNVQSGQTIVISGLVDISASKGFGGIPGLGSIPVLGRLFKSEAYRAGRSDLVVFVTPRVITSGSPANLDAIERSDRMLREFRGTIGKNIFD